MSKVMIFQLSVLDGDVPLTTLYSVYISQLVGFARVCNNVFATLTITTVITLSIYI